MTLEQRIAKLLIHQKKTLAVAESCTGGLLCHRLTNIPGSSRFFKFGWILYSNESKARLLKISPRIFVEHGAVSGQAAQQMAEGIRGVLKTDFGIGVTGIAGPAGGTRQKPVGLVFIAVAASDQTLTESHVFKGNRKRIKSQAATRALRLLGKLLSAPHQ